MFVPFPNSETSFEIVKMKKSLRGLITGVGAIAGFDFHHFCGFVKLTFPFYFTPSV